MGRAERGRARRARARAGRAGRGLRDGLPGARDAGRDGRRARRARAAARAPRRAAGAVARAVEETALALGVAHLLERRTDTLSGGELQRVAIAAAMVHAPQLLLLDEPTSQLDPVAGDELVWLLRRLNEDFGTAVVMAEHRLERCLPAADRVIAMEGGRVACDSTPAGFLAWAAAAAPALETPAARLFSLAGLTPPPVTVKEARAALAAASPGPSRARAERPPPRLRLPWRRGPAAGARAARRLARDRGRPGRAARRHARARAGRARRADGAQRRRQEHAAQGREGARRAEPRARRVRRARWRCCCRTRATT